jgi:hypothetical protein
MAPRLHRPARHDQEEDHGPEFGLLDANGTTIPIRHVNEVELAMLHDFFGVNDLAAVEGTDERTVHLSDRSDVVCPAHHRMLKPDACRSCRFLAGEK